MELNSHLVEFRKHNVLYQRIKGEKIKLNAYNLVHDCDILQKCVKLFCATGGKNSHKEGEINIYTLFLIKHTC